MERERDLSGLRLMLESVSFAREAHPFAQFDPRPTVDPSPLPSVKRTTHRLKISRMTPWEDFDPNGDLTNPKVISWRTSVTS